MKKLINDPDAVVSEALLGIAAAHPSLTVDHANRVIMRADAGRPGKVGIVSGGGSGHEPLHGGFVGFGMLDAACAGEIFTSPAPDQMLAATRRSMAARESAHREELHRRRHELRDGGRAGAADGSEVQSWSSTTTSRSRTALDRGPPRCWRDRLLEKISGAAAGRVARWHRSPTSRAGSTRTAAAWVSPSPPARCPQRQPTFELGEDEMELGMGIHGEPGREARTTHPPPRSPSCWSSRSWVTCRSRPVTRSSRS